MNKFKKKKRYNVIIQIFDKNIDLINEFLDKKINFYYDGSGYDVKKQMYEYFFYNIPQYTLKRLINKIKKSNIIKFKINKKKIMY